MLSSEHRNHNGLKRSDREIWRNSAEVSPWRLTANQRNVTNDLKKYEDEASVRMQLIWYMVMAFFFGCGM